MASDESYLEKSPVPNYNNTSHRFVLQVLSPTYKSRSEDFKRIFKDIPNDERLMVGKYSHALWPQSLCVIFAVAIFLRLSR